MNTYQLVDIEKKTLAEVIEFTDNQVAVKWCGEIRSLVVFKDIEEFKKISVICGRQLLKIE